MSDSSVFSIPYSKKVLSVLRMTAVSVRDAIMTVVSRESGIFVIHDHQIVVLYGSEVNVEKFSNDRRKLQQRRDIVVSLVCNARKLKVLALQAFDTPEKKLR